MQAEAGASQTIFRSARSAANKRRESRQRREMLSADAGRPAMDTASGLNGVLAAVAAWQSDRSSMAASQLRDRLRRKIQTYFGSPTVRAVERPGIRAEELLGKTNEMLEVFLGANAAEVVIDDVVRELDWRGRAGRDASEAKELPGWARVGAPMDRPVSGRILDRRSLRAVPLERRGPGISG